MQKTCGFVSDMETSDTDVGQGGCADTRGEILQKQAGNPKCIFLFSGKRKSGKDYITSLVFERIGSDKSLIIRISAPIKEHWSKKHSLDMNEMLEASEYKEKYRHDMIIWSESVRAKDYGYFCRAALEMHNAFEKPVWIVSDTRRKTDLTWFREHFSCPVKTVRVIADDAVRQQRNWVFTTGVDDVASECDLDDVQEWDMIITNNGDGKELQIINSIVTAANSFTI